MKQKNLKRVFAGLLAAVMLVTAVPGTDYMPKAVEVKYNGKDITNECDFTYTDGSWTTANSYSLKISGKTTETQQSVIFNPKLLKCSLRESNPQLALRRRSLYPFN